MRVKFLNWRPDLEDVGNDGLTTADNVVHDVEGYRPVHIASSGAFSTSISIGFDSSVLSVVSKPVGAQGDQFCAWVSNATTPTLHVGINGETASTTATGYPLTMATAATDAEIFAFDVCEYAGYIIWTVEAEATDASATALSYAFMGYMNY